jgi:pimeloyl-ACP methyl ester carboxylesterase
MNGLTQALGLSKFTLYMQDYGGPVGYRMTLAYPERVEALIVQDAVAHNEGLGANWATRRAFCADRPAHEEALRKNLLWKRQKHSTSATILTSTVMIPIYGRTSMPFSTHRDRQQR